MTIELGAIILLIITAGFVLWLLTKAYNSLPCDHLQSRTTEDEDATIPTIIGLSMLMDGDDEE